jgi:hypothetical protein
VPVASRSSSARYGEPVRVLSRSLRVHANTPLTSAPGRSVLIVAALPDGESVDPFAPLAAVAAVAGRRAVALVRRSGVTVS